MMNLSILKETKFVTHRVISKERINNLVNDIKSQRQNRKYSNKSSLNAKLPSFGNNNYLYVNDKDFDELNYKNKYPSGLRYKVKPNTSVNNYKDQYFNVQGQINHPQNDQIVHSKISSVLHGYRGKKALFSEGYKPVKLKNSIMRKRKTIDFQ